MPAAERFPARVPGLALEGEHRANRVAGPFEQRLIVEHLPEPEADLARFIGVGEALHLDNGGTGRVTPREVEGRITTSRG